VTNDPPSESGGFWEKASAAEVNAITVVLGERILAQGSVERRQMLVGDPATLLSWHLQRIEVILDFSYSHRQCEPPSGERIQG
jgi:hypothetical protein